MTAADTVSTSLSEADESGSSSWWPWLLAGLAVAAVIGTIVFLRSRKSPQWVANAAASLDESDQITTHLIGLAPGGLSAVAGPDAARLARLMVTVQQLMTSAPDDPSRGALAQVQEPLSSLHSALDALALRQGTPSAEDLDELTSRATALHAATSFARATLVPPATTGPPA